MCNPIKKEYLSIKDIDGFNFYDQHGYKYYINTYWFIDKLIAEKELTYQKFKDEMLLYNLKTKKSATGYLENNYNFQLFKIFNQWVSKYLHEVKVEK